MVHTYRYIYFRISTWHARALSESDLAQFGACLGLAILSIVNLLSLLIVTGLATSRHLEIIFIALVGLSFVAHHLYFVRTGRYRKLEEEFRVKPLLAPGPGLFLVCSYVAGSLGLFFILAFTGNH